MEHNNNPTIKQSKTITVQGWKSCRQLTTSNLSHFKMVEDMGSNYCVEVHLNGITSLPNIMKIYQAVQKLLVGHTHMRVHADRLVIL
jgi:hypothetical protein